MYPHLIYKAEMAFCSFLSASCVVPYTNPHFWSDLYRTCHMSSPPWSAGGRGLCVDPQYSTLRPLRPLFSRVGAAFCAEDGCRRESFPRHPHIRHCWSCSCDIAGVNVTRQQFRVPTGNVLYCRWCIQNVENRSEYMFVKTETWRDGQEVTNELQLHLRCDYTNDNVKPI
jgi:hypothetical protein